MQAETFEREIATGCHLSVLTGASKYFLINFLQIFWYMYVWGGEEG